MKCCDQNENKTTNNNKKKGHFNHMWMMLLCCGAPILVLFVISLLGTSFPEIKLALVSILPFLCPIMMLIMIPMMFMKGKNNSGCHEKTSIEDTQND